MAGHGGNCPQPPRISLENPMEGPEDRRREPVLVLLQVVQKIRGGAGPRFLPYEERGKVAPRVAVAAILMERGRCAPGGERRRRGPLLHREALPGRVAPFQDGLDDQVQPFADSGGTGGGEGEQPQIAVRDGVPAPLPESPPRDRLSHALLGP